MISASARPYRLCVSAIAILFSVLFAVHGCGRAKPERESVRKSDPLWAEFLASHTSGVISRGSPIRVVFATEVAADRVGKDASSTVEIKPSINGSIQFASSREIVIAPKTEFSPGQTYRVTVKPTNLKGVPATLSPFEFLVDIKRPEFEVAVDGLTSDRSNEGSLQLKGVVSTADAEHADKVETLLRASYAGKPTKIEWSHSADGLRHEFAVHGLSRGMQQQMLTLDWDGRSIGAKNSGRNEVAVPPRDQFIVTQVSTAEDGGQRYIRVFFSDTLDPHQDFKGLVRLSRGEPSTRVDGNVLRVYPDQAFEGQATLSLEAGIRNRLGDKLEAAAQYPITFSSTKPQVKFVGTGVILPDAKLLTVPFEAVNVRSVRVTAFQIYEDNLTQFFQVNELNGSNQLGRVGRNLWRKTIAVTAADSSRWNRYSLDVTELLKKYPGAMIRLTLSIARDNSAYACPSSDQATPEEPLVDPDTNDQAEQSNWDYVEEYFGVKDGSTWADRDNPCKDAYYAYGEHIRDGRNFIVSNLGLLAKKDQRGHWIVVATDLRTAEPLSGVQLTALSYQAQPLATASTDNRGMADFTLKSQPYMMLAQKGSEKGYLKVQPGVALPVSHFDVGGERVTEGIKGFIYGERGVWRPGDDIYLTFVLQDKDQNLPANHPVTMELFNPQSQLTQTLVNTTPVNGFYTFKLQTAGDAPTGTWTAKATLGGATFTKPLKIETVMPNRLKVALNLDEKTGDLLDTTAQCPSDKQCDSAIVVRGNLSSQWLSGASAAGLKADVKMRLTPAGTKFDRFADFVFDDPAREFTSEPQEIFSGELNDRGEASIEKSLEPITAAPGMLTASFTTRVFERGGAFSINYSSHSLSPYRDYIGLKLPKGDVSRGMLRTDVQHTVELASLSADGQPTAVKQVEVTLYKVDWKWWWDQSGDSLAQYAQRTHTSVIQQSTVSTKDGKGAWQFEIKYPQWGRYLIRACDLDGGHCTGQTFYIDWPMWAGRAQDQSGPAANVLVFSADKDKYKVGDTATLQLPEAKEGRALLTIENGSAILDARWIDFAHDSNKVTVPITQAMAPNVYASVTMVQPHGKTNDRPIRMYGVIPLFVEDPQTILAPTLNVASEWKPESIGAVEVGERNHHDMTYTLAVVDEGLLDLTSFKTPNLHDQFYKREALGIATWDLFDQVTGAYGVELERLLALGGSDAAKVKNPDERKTRFPPVVSFLGPFELKAGQTRSHQIKIPQYIGAVRVMLVAGQRGAYGSAEKSVFVRQPLMLLPTLPRVLGPEEEVAVPVSVFVSDPSIKQVALTLETDSIFEIVGDSTTQVGFTRPEERLAMLRIKSKARVGRGAIKFVATSGDQRAEAKIDLEVRSPNAPTTERLQKVLEAGEEWNVDLVPHGMAGTNAVTLEISAVPPLDLERRLDYLIQYPYGCLEQTTSSVFPQLYLPTLLKLEDSRKNEIQRNVQLGIERLAGFQMPNGAFAYWPGGYYWPDAALRDNWSNSYAGHFLLEAKQLGYAVPEAMLNGWVRAQRSTAQSWSERDDAATVDQAYRLYTLALAKQPEIGAMNRLRERDSLVASAKWMLAAAYQLAGLSDAAKALAKGTQTRAQEYAFRDRVLGSDLRDEAVALNALVTLGQRDAANTLADEVSHGLISDSWYSTQSTAYALLAMTHYVGNGEVGTYTFTRGVNGKTQPLSVSTPMYTEALRQFPDRGATVNVANTSSRRLFVTLSDRGTPNTGTDSAGSQGLNLKVEYRDEEGKPLDPAHLPQGSDLIAQAVLTNTAQQRIDNIALAQLFPAGWEIHNDRMEGGQANGTREDGEPKPLPWWYEGSIAALASKVERVDIRDDRIYRYFSLKPQERITFTTRLNAAYRGRFYLPSVVAEAMYDASRFAKTKGQWVEVDASR